MSIAELIAHPGEARDYGEACEELEDRGALLLTVRVELEQFAQPPCTV